jgi:hypothetical protein
MDRCVTQLTVYLFNSAHQQYMSVYKSYFLGPTQPTVQRWQQPFNRPAVPPFPHSVARWPRANAQHCNTLPYLSHQLLCPLHIPSNSPLVITTSSRKVVFPPHSPRMPFDRWSIVRRTHTERKRFKGYSIVVCLTTGQYLMAKRMRRLEG